MKAINAKAQKVMETMIGKMQKGYAKIDNAPGSYMSVSIEEIGAVEMGPVYAVAHYYEQNGDLMRDPEMVFVKGFDGRFYPISFQNDGIGRLNESVLFESGKCKGYRPQMQKDQAVFAGVWMNNIKQQQGI